MLTKEQIQAVMQAVKEDEVNMEYMGYRFLEELEARFSIGDSKNQFVLWPNLVEAIINDDLDGVFSLLFGKDIEELLKECSIIPREEGNEAYIQTMPWEKDLLKTN